MSTLSELIKEREKLPAGDVYYKTIGNRKYAYHQYFKDGKRYTSFVKKSKLEELQNAIKKRKEIEKQIKKIKKRELYVSLSKNAKYLTGYVMSGNIKVAEFNNGELVKLNEELAPLIIKRTKSLEEFLRLRVIDMSRTNARLLRKALNIDVDEEYKISLYSYAQSISDDFWFKPKNSKLTHKEVLFEDDDFFEISLMGDTTVFPLKGRSTPEITTTGSFEKGWKLIGDEWWLYKSGNMRQYFSELFCYQFARLIGLDTAIYSFDGFHVRTKNFSPKHNFEPMAAIAGSNDNYEYVFNKLFAINASIAKDYLKLIFFDSVVYNIDRHNENTGLLRERGTGKIISLAPNFDNNLALVSTVDILKEPSKDAFMKIFIDFIAKNKKAQKLVKSIHLPEIFKEDVRRCAIFTTIVVDNIDDLIEKVYQRYNYLKSVIEKEA